jgi:hypothetical protein
MQTASNGLDHQETTCIAHTTNTPRWSASNSVMERNLPHQRHPPATFVHDAKPHEREGLEGEVQARGRAHPQQHPPRVGARQQAGHTVQWSPRPQRVRNPAPNDVRSRLRGGAHQDPAECTPRVHRACDERGGVCDEYETGTELQFSVNFRGVCPISTAPMTNTNILEQAVALWA